MNTLYDPLHYDNLARSVVDALLNADLAPLPPDRFNGAGVYAIYYSASLDYSLNVSEGDDREAPIYVGKAVPTGARKGGGEPNWTSSQALHQRLRDHAKSVRQTTNLSLDDTKCRYLAVVPVWITLAERFLIDHFKPVWNTVLDGFGNHDPGSGRANMRRPRWDIMHPGRPWAARLRAAETKEQILDAIEKRPH